MQFYCLYLKLFNFQKLKCLNPLNKIIRSDFLASLNLIEKNGSTDILPYVTGIEKIETLH